MASSFRHVGIVVDDCNKYLPIFQDCLELTLVSDELEQGDFIDHLLGASDIRVRVVKLCDRRMNVVELIEFENNQYQDNKVEVNTLGITHFALNVEKIDAVICKLEQHNAKRINTPKINQSNECKVAYVAVGNSFFIELVEKLDQP